MCLFIICWILSSTEVHSTSVLWFLLLSALKECLFKILDGLWVNLGPYRKRTNLCLDFCASAHVTLYPVGMARRRDFLTCIIQSKLALPSFLPFTSLLCCLPFLYFCTFIFRISHWAPLFWTDISGAIMFFILRVKECCGSPFTDEIRFF